MGGRKRSRHFGRNVSVISKHYLTILNSFFLYLIIWLAFLRALPNLADSEEELITTRFEVSKMD